MANGQARCFGISTVVALLACWRPAIAQAPPARAAESIPVRIVSTAPERAGALAAALRQAVPTLDIVGPGDFARFVIDLKDTRCRVFGAAGLEEIGRFDASDPAELVRELSRLLFRSVRSAELLALDNSSSAIQLEVRAVLSAAREERPPDGRAVAVQSNPRPPEYRVRRRGEPRLASNSLQLEIRASAPVYVTIADVDPDGRVNLLFPNAIQDPEFYPLGLIPKDEIARIPDSLAPGNRAGFNWDLSPPAGVDTIRVFASESLETANLIRNLIEQAGASRRESPTATLRALGQALEDPAASRAFVHRPAPGAQPSAHGNDWAARSVIITVKE